MKNENLFNLYEEFKNSNKLKYQEAFEIILDLLKGNITGRSLKKNEKYEMASLPIAEAYIDLVIENPFEDHLGKLYQEIIEKNGKKPLSSQFFTPFPISKILVGLTQSKAPKNSTWKRFNDPCAGFGALPLAFCEDNQGKTVELILNDTDPLCCEVSMIQILFSFILRKEIGNLKLIITRGDILKSPFGEEIYYTFGYNSRTEILFTLLGRDKP